MKKELDGWEYRKSVEVGSCSEIVNFANDCGGTKCRWRNYEEDFDWKSWSEEGFNRDGATNFVLRPERAIAWYKLSLIFWLKETFCGELLWVMNCFKYDPEMKHETCSELHQCCQDQRVMLITTLLKTILISVFDHCSCWVSRAGSNKCSGSVFTAKITSKVTRTVI